MRRAPILPILLAVAATLAATPADAVNYVPNPGFETCTSSPASWGPVAMDVVGCDAANPNAGAFSLGLQNGPNAGLARAQSDCIAVPAGDYLASTSYAYRTGSTDVVQVALTVEAFTDAGCASTHGVASLGAGFSFGPMLFTDGQWHTLGPTTFLVDNQTHGVRFVASFQLPPTSTAVVSFDDLSFDAGGGPTTTSTTSSTPTTTVGGTPSTVTASTTTSTTQPPTFTGTGPAATECYVTLVGIRATSGIQSDCVDGDLDCDRDGAADGACTFAFRVCAAQSLAGCQATSITSVKASPGNLAMPVPPLPVADPTCGAEARVTVPLRRQGRAAGRRALTFVARNSVKPKLDRDRLKLRCLPPG